MICRSSRESLGRSRALQPDLFEWRRPRIGIDEHQRWLGHARSDAARPDILEDGAVAHALVHEALDLMQHRLALLPVRLRGLLLEKSVDVRIATVGVGSVARDDFGKTGGGVAVERAGAYAHPLGLLGGDQGEVGAALHGAHLEARSEEHTSELQSLRHLVCRLLL